MGRFERLIYLPPSIHLDASLNARLEKTFDDGVLTLTFPKRE
jgi:HSP20 family molecular chaperone IbpA